MNEMPWTEFYFQIKTLGALFFFGLFVVGGIMAAVVWGDIWLKERKAKRKKPQPFNERERR